jgi:Tfp pilus assembly protein PilN
VRAVNLIPPEQRRGAGGIAGRSGGAVYVLIATLVVLVALGLVYAFAVHDVAKRTTTLAQVTNETNVVTGQVATLGSYVQFKSLSQASVTSVAQLAAQRFDWARAMKQVALSLPPTVTISSLAGTAAAATGAGVSGATSDVGAAAPATFSIAGCASTQLVLATALTRMRELQGVTSVTLSTYLKPQGLGLKPTHAVAYQPCTKVNWNMAINYGPGFGVPTRALPFGATSEVER